MNTPVNTGGILANPMPLAPQESNKSSVTKYEVDGQTITLTKDAVRRYLVQGDGKNVTDQEIMYFMALCKAQHLNPFIKDAYLVKFGTSPATILTSIGALEKRASSFAEFDGIKSGIVIMKEDGTTEEREGACYLKSRETLIGGWAEIKRKDRSVPTHVSLSLDEYIQTKKDGAPNSNWAGKPATMIRKCAKACAYREAFPKQNSGLYEASEIRQIEQIEPLEQLENTQILPIEHEAEQEEIQAI